MERRKVVVWADYHQCPELLHAGRRTRLTGSRSTDFRVRSMVTLPRGTNYRLVASNPVEFGGVSVDV